MIHTAASNAGALTLVCAKCTRFGVFEGETRLRAELAAGAAGWSVRQRRVVCPACGPAPTDRPAHRPKSERPKSR